jgi:hypothetical protein
MLQGIFSQKLQLTVIKIFADCITLYLELYGQMLFFKLCVYSLSQVLAVCGIIPTGQDNNWTLQS